MTELEALAPALDRRDQPGPFRLLEPVDQLVLARARDRLEQRDVEDAPDERGRREELAGLVAQPFQPPADHQPHGLGNVELRDVDVGAPVTLRVEQAALLEQVLEHLLDEEGVAVALVVDRTDQPFGRLLAGQRAEHRRHAPALETPQGQPLREPAAAEVFDRARERTPHLELDVTVGAEDQDRQLGQPVGHVLEQQQRRLIGPVKVVEDDQQRSDLCRPRQEVADRVEQVAPFLLRRQVHRRWDVVEGAPELRADARDLSGRFSEDRPERLRALGAGEGLLEDLDPRGVRSGALPLDAVSGQDADAQAIGLRRELLRQARLAHAGLTADQHQGAPSRGGVLERAPEIGQFLLALDEGCALQHPRAGRGRRRALAPVDLPEPPALREALQPEEPAVDVGGPRAGEVLHDRRDQDLPAPCPPHDPGRRVDGLAEQVAVFGRHLAGVQADPDPDAVLDQGSLDLRGRADRAGGRPERGHQPVAERLHHASAGPLDVIADQPLLRAEEVLRLGVADPRAEVRRSLDVGEQDGGGLGCAHRTPFV